MSTNKQQLISMFAEKMEITKKDSEKYITGLIELIEDVTVKEGKIQIIGHGTYEVKDVPAKSGVSKLKGIDKPWSTEPCKKITFKCGKNFLDKCNS